MKFSTAFKISGFYLLALAIELVSAYFVFSHYAFSLTESGQYSAAEAYSTGPMGTLAKVFYGIFGGTVAIAILAPVLALLSLLIRR